MNSNLFCNSFIRYLDILRSSPYGIFNICGEHGSGKTSCVKEYAYLAEKEGYKIFFFPQTNHFPSSNYNEEYISYQELYFWLNSLVKYTNDRCLFIIDSIFTINNITSDIEYLIINFHNLHPKTKILITSLFNSKPNNKINYIYINPLTKAESHKYIENFNIPLHEQLINMIIDYSNGNPLLLNNFLHALISSKNPQRIVYNDCIVDLDGNPLSSKIKNNTIIKVSEINDQLLYELSKNPKLLYNLSPYDFERVIAKMFEKRGFSVKITPQTRDGGKDIFIAKNDLCSFLFYVECKKYAPNCPVGIDVIQRLYGVVSAEKATGGIIATTSYFTKPAKDYIQENHIDHQLTLQDYDTITNILRTL